VDESAPVEGGPAGNGKARSAPGFLKLARHSRNDQYVVQFIDLGDETVQFVLVPNAGGEITVGAGANVGLPASNSAAAALIVCAVAAAFIEARP